MRYWLLVLLVTGLVTVAGYALVQPLQTPQQVTTTYTANTVNIETLVQATEQTSRQTAERVLVLNISVDGVEFAPGSTMHLKATIRNTGTEEVLLEYFAGQLFEVVIRDGSGSIVYVHSDRGFQKYLVIAPLHLRLAPGESHTETMEIPLVYTRGDEKGQPLPPGNYTLTVYLTAAVQGHPSGIIDGVKAYTAASLRIIVRP
jgi:ribosomal protein L21E